MARDFPYCKPQVMCQFRYESRNREIKGASAAFNANALGFCARVSCSLSSNSVCSQTSGVFRVICCGRPIDRRIRLIFGSSGRAVVLFGWSNCRCTPRSGEESFEERSAHEADPTAGHAQLRNSSESVKISAVSANLSRIRVRRRGTRLERSAAPEARQFVISSLYSLLVRK